MNKELEEAMKRLRECVRNSDDEYATVIIQQAFSDMEEERKQRDETEQSLSKWIVELQAKLDKIVKLCNQLEYTESINHDTIIAIKLDILKEETKCINGK